MVEANYIVVEGVIGVGKTSLAKILAEKINARVVLEEVEENPFLEDFYRDPARFAFQVQIFFLLSRYRQQMEFPQQDLFQQRTVSDYLFDKDKIFAYINLNEKELSLYERLWSFLYKDVPRPDLVIYLQANTETLMHRIRERNRSYEQNISNEYIQRLNEAYNYFFFHYTESPLLVVNTAKIDFVHNPDDLEDLLEQIRRPHLGTRYYVPMRE
ncbi:MAG: deoxyadenosine kinase [candidate division Zixibacteria bacterium SM23_81]|nr:MAG: deoxyadenosine kinase [candidate division Zixibacteria bacterium SM23_81]